MLIEFVGKNNFRRIFLERLFRGQRLLGGKYLLRTYASHTNNESETVGVFVRIQLPTYCVSIASFRQR